MIFRCSGPPLTPQDIERVEALVGCPLPAPYRDFMLEHNGGIPRPSGFRIVLDKIGPVDECVDGFHSINRGTLHSDLERAIKSDRDPRQDHEHFEIPADAIWIGAAMAGEIVLFVKGLRTGQVWLKQREEDHNNSMEGMCFLASTFDQFLSMLTPCEWDPPDGAEPRQ